MKHAAVVPVVPAVGAAPGPASLLPRLFGAALGPAAHARRRRPRGPAWGRRRRRRRGSGGACCCCPARGDMRPLYLLQEEGLPRLGTSCCACCANSARNYAFSGPLRVRYGRSRRRRVAARRLACLPLMRPGWNSNPHLEARRLPSDWRLVATVGCVRRRIKKFRLLMLSKLRHSGSLQVLVGRRARYRALRPAGII